MGNYIVESQFEYKGFTCIVVMQSLAYRCGYVGVTKDHPLYGMKFGWDDSNIKVHGSLTHSGGGEKSTYPIESDFWWLGFSCAHKGDGKDYEKALELFRDNPAALKRINTIRAIESTSNRSGEKVCTLEYVENECRNLADQLSAMEGVNAE